MMARMRIRLSKDLVQDDQKYYYVIEDDGETHWEDNDGVIITKDLIPWKRTKNPDSELLPGSSA